MTKFLGWFVVFALLIPVLHTVWVSFSPGSFLMLPKDEWSLRWYREFGHDRRWQAAMARSLAVACLAGILSVYAATSAAIAFRHSFGNRRRILELCLLLPACLPTVAIGMGLLPLFHLTGLWGSLLGVVLVHGMLGLPVAYLIVRTHLTPALDEHATAARGLGASRWQTWWRITFPLLRPAIVSAIAAVSVLSLNESLVTLFVATPNSETLPVVVWPQLRYAATPLIAVSSVLTMAISGCGVGIAIMASSRSRPRRPR